MKRILWLLAGLGLALLAASALQAEEGREKAAESAALRWLALVDAGHYAESWKDASSAFRKAVTQAQWEAAIQAARAPFGRLLSRRMKGAEYRTSLPGAPDG